MHSWIRLAAKFDFEFVCACPKGFEPDPATMELAKEAGGKVAISHDAMEVRVCHLPSSIALLWYLLIQIAKGCD